MRHNIGQKRIALLKKSDIKRYYNYLADERGLKPTTIDGVHTVLHQVLNMACPHKKLLYFAMIYTTYINLTLIDAGFCAGAGKSHNLRWFRGGDRETSNVNVISEK